MSVVAFAARPSFNLADTSTLALDIHNIKPKDIVALVETFEADIKASPELGPVPVPTGWAKMTPEIAVDLMRRNRPGTNRRIDPATVVYYALQMARDDWKATGQAILIDLNGHLMDGQHRLLAIIISGRTVKTYVVTDVEPIPNLFAYIDNVRSRTVATALQTAGYDGASSLIGQIIKLGEQIAARVFNPGGGTKLARLSPADGLTLVSKYPNAKIAARMTATDWRSVAAYVGHKDVLGYFGMAVIDLHGEGPADDFVEALGEDVERAVDDPIAALRKVLDRNNKATKPMPRQNVLAALILGFNAWFKNEPLRGRWMRQVNEDMPVLEAPEAESQAAE